MLHANVLKWWTDLGTSQRELLVELVYSLDLSKYVKIDCNGRYIKLKGLDNTETGDDTYKGI